MSITCNSRKANVRPVGHVVPKGSQHSSLRTSLTVALDSQVVMGACWARPGGNSAWGQKCPEREENQTDQGHKMLYFLAL